MRDLWRVYIKALLFSLPFLGIIGSYILIDPFDILFEESFIQPSYKNTNTDYKRVNSLLKTHEDHAFDTFTFGNSQIQAFIGPYPESIPNAQYHDLHNPGESIWNIYRKVKLVDSLGLKLDHVLITMNTPLIENVRNTSPVYRGTAYLHHPASQGSSWVDFHTDAFGFYLAEFYFVKYLDFITFHTYRPSMEGVIPKGQAAYIREGHATLNEAPGRTVPKAGLFYEGKDESTDDVSLDPGDRVLLEEMRTVFEKHGSELIILFPPNSNIIRINPDVVEDVTEIFGEEHVFDFTGKNPFIRESPDFIDNVHFKPIVAKRILDHLRTTGKNF